MQCFYVNYVLTRITAWWCYIPMKHMYKFIQFIIVPVWFLQLTFDVLKVPVVISYTLRFVIINSVNTHGEFKNISEMLSPQHSQIFHALSFTKFIFIWEKSTTIWSYAYAVRMMENLKKKTILQYQSIIFEISTLINSVLFIYSYRYHPKNRYCPVIKAETIV